MNQQQGNFSKMQINVFNLDDKAARARLEAENPIFGAVFNFLTAKPLDELARISGKVDLLGDDAFLNFSKNVLKMRGEAKLEAHDKYIDLQLVLNGREKIGVRARGECRDIIDDRLAQNDVVFFGEEFDEVVEVGAGQYVVLYPDCAHAPCVGEGEDCKCVAKIRLI